MVGKVDWRFVGVGGVLTVVAVLAWTHRNAGTGGASQPLAHDSPQGGQNAPSPREERTWDQTPPPTRIVRITPDQRLDLVIRIQSAKAQRRDLPNLPSQSKTAAVADPPSMDMNNPQDVLAQLQGISKEISAATAECTRKYAPNLEAFKTELTLEGDPDVGTLINASTPLVDGSGASVPPAFDDCVRAEFQNLELPPMKSGDKYTVTYSEGIRE